MAGRTALRVLVAPGVLRGVNLTDITFGTQQTYPVATKKISTLPGYPSLRNVINSLSVDTVIDLEGGTFQDADFAMGNNTFTYYGGNLIGLVNGSVTQKANSSTHVSAVNTQVANNSGTVQETVLRIGRGTSKATTPYIGDLTMIATPQGHIYNGFVIYYCTNALIERLTIKGYPGSASYPPGETFEWNNLHSTNTVVKDSVFDGIGVTASNTGNNTSNGMTFIRCQFLNTGSGHGVAHYLSSDPTYIDCTFSGNAKSGANFEKVSGTITLVNPTFHSNQHNMIVDTDGTSAVVNIYDPVWDGLGTGTKFQILRHNTYNYPPPAVSPNAQSVSDFHIFRGGTWSGGSHGVGTYVGGTETTSTDLQVISN